MKLDNSSFRPCDQAPLIVAKRKIFPDATGIRFRNGKATNYAETPNYYLDFPAQKEWTRTNSRVFVFSDVMDEWFELEYDEHFNRRRQEDAQFRKTTAAKDSGVPAAQIVQSTPVPWWNRHYTLPTNGIENTFFAVEHVTPDNCRAESGALWHEHNANINTQRQHDLIALRRFIRGAICGQEGTE